MTLTTIPTGDGRVRHFNVGIVRNGIVAATAKQIRLVFGQKILRGKMRFVAAIALADFHGYVNAHLSQPLVGLIVTIGTEGIAVGAGQVVVSRTMGFMTSQTFTLAKGVMLHMRIRNLIGKIMAGDTKFFAFQYQQFVFRLSMGLMAFQTTLQGRLVTTGI